MSFPKNKVNLEVLLYALSQQVEPLPADLQRSLTEIGQGNNLQVHPTDEDKIKIRELVAGYQPLEMVYRDALTRSNQNYVSQERTRNSNATFSTISGLDELSIEKFLLPTNDWVSAAKQLANNLISPQTIAKFWDKTDRMAVTTAGGIAIGSAIAQLPGAIVGCILGAGYGWYIGFRKPIESRNVNGTSINSHNVVMADNNSPDLSIDFGDLSTEQLAMMAQSATQDAIKDLHKKGISTYGMQEGIIYETNPVTNTKSVVEEYHQT